VDGAVGWGNYWAPVGSYPGSSIELSGSIKLLEPIGSRNSHLGSVLRLRLNRQTYEKLKSDSIV